MKKLIFLLLTCFIFSGAYAQTPTSCFEIESILVDACGNPEGENEMVLFHVGPAALNTSNLTVAWPNNSWLGICQNATTAGKVAQLNATILNCGYLLEPSGGVLPAGSRVLLITSTNFSVAANSFAGLSDTLYVIFQCAGNTSGHFANATSSGNRTLTMTFSSPAGCSDVVTYNCQSLVDIYGNTGTAGPTSDRDGSTVEFAWNGTPTYTNDGCNAPYQPLVVDAGPDSVICQADTIQLNGNITGNVTNFSWSGGNGSFLNGNTTTPSYVVSPSDNGTIALILTASNCNGPIRDTVYFTLSNGPGVSITPAGPINLCQGNTQVLTANGGGPYSWSTGQSGSSITVSTAGTYYVTATNSCGTDTAFITVTVTQLPTVNIQQSGNIIICTGNQTTLNASGTGGTINWSTGGTGASITTGNAGMVYATVTNSCGTAIDSVQITLSNTASVNITPGGPISLCAGDSVQLTANGSGTFSWNTGSGASSIYVSSAGTYIVTLTSSCGTASDTVQVINNGNPPVAGLDIAAQQSICNGQTVTFNASGGGNYSWSTGSTGTSQTFSTPGNYWVAVSNSCGSDTAYITVSNATPPQANITQGTDSTICQGNSITLSATGNGTLNWSNGQSGSSIQVNTAGMYYVVDSNACGTDTAFFQLSLIGIHAQFTADTLIGIVPLDVNFTNTSTGAASYSWNFGDGDTSGVQNPSHQYTAPGAYIVILTAYNSLGCSDTASAIVLVDSCDFTMMIPNVVTPNYDAVNDNWTLNGTCVDQLQVYIYNRWGYEVYSFTDMLQGWDGNTSSGASTTDGVYFYVIEVEDFNGDHHRFTGTISVFK